VRTPATRTLVPAAPRLSVCHGDSLSARMPGLRGYTRKCQAFSLAALANGRTSGRAVKAAPAKPAASDRPLVFGDSTSLKTKRVQRRYITREGDIRATRPDKLLIDGLEYQRLFRVLNDTDVIFKRILALD